MLAFMLLASACVRAVSILLGADCVGLVVSEPCEPVGVARQVGAELGWLVTLHGHCDSHGIFILHGGEVYFAALVSTLLVGL